MRVSAVCAASDGISGPDGRSCQPKYVLKHSSFHIRYGIDAVQPSFDVFNLGWFGWLGLVYMESWLARKCFALFWGVTHLISRRKKRMVESLPDISVPEARISKLIPAMALGTSLSKCVRSGVVCLGATQLPCCARSCW